MDRKSQQLLTTVPQGMTTASGLLEKIRGRIDPETLPAELFTSEVIVLPPCLMGLKV